MRRAVSLGWAGANVVLAVALLASLVLATDLTIPLLAVALLGNGVGTMLESE